MLGRPHLHGAQFGADAHRARQVAYFHVEAHAAIYEPAGRFVSLLTLSRTANESFRALFRDTFDAELVALTPWRRASDLVEGTPAATVLDGLRRSDFHRPSADGLGRRVAASGTEVAS